MNDTQRLNFLLRFLRVDDIGDEEFVPGVVVYQEDLEEKLTYGKSVNGVSPNIVDKERDLRTIIDRAIEVHGLREGGEG